YNSWCLNLWLEETTLSVIPDKRSVYTAYEVCQARWVISKDSIEEKFLNANSWVLQYIPNYFEYRLQNTSASSLEKTSSFAFNSVFNLLNSAAYHTQRWYMQRHMTIERVGKTFAFFHPRDTKRSIINEWKKVLTQIL
ncbi:MAG: hypothetical protein QG639_252, partial [Patescibacteria group bacterium]|nr:hypothetical protein [Patescibacteria group bacterium]